MHAYLDVSHCDSCYMRHAVTISATGALRAVTMKQQQKQHASEDGTIRSSSNSSIEASVARQWAAGVVEAVLQRAAVCASEMSVAEARAAAVEAAAEAAEAVIAAAEAAISAAAPPSQPPQSLPPPPSSLDTEAIQPTATPVIRSAAAAPEIGAWDGARVTCDA